MGSFRFSSLLKDGSITSFGADLFFLLKKKNKHKMLASMIIVIVNIFYLILIPYNLRLIYTSE